MAKRHQSDESGNSRLTNRQESTDPLLGRRSVLKLTGAAAAASLGVTSTTAAEYRTITVGAGESRRFDLGSGDTLENVLIDVTADNADVFITARGSGWAVRNVGVRGAFDVGADNNILDDRYGGGFHQVMNCSGDGVIENVYLGDGCVEGVDRTALNVGEDHGGHIDLVNCYVARWSSNACYTAGFGRDEGGHGTIAYRNCYFRDNNVAHLRLAADGTEVEGCVVHNTNNVPVLPLSNGGAENVVMSRGIYTGYGDAEQTITVRDSDIAVTDENTNGGAAAVISNGHPTYGDTTTVRLENSRVAGDLDGEYVETANVSGNPQTSVPSGVPTTPEEAASGSTSSGGSSGGSTGDTGDSNDSETLSNVLSVSGGGPGNVLDYAFEVTGSVEKSTANDATIDSEDEISDGSVTGAVAGGVDSYRFGGEIASFEVEGDASVTLNGDTVDPASFNSGSGSGAQTNTLTIAGGSPSNVIPYALTVSDAVEKSDANGASINPDDAVCGATASGQVLGGVDSYEFTGEITAFQVDGDATVSLNGNPVDPDALGVASSLPSVVVVDASRAFASAEYSFETTGDVVRVSGCASHGNDQIADGTVEGFVADGVDRYRFSGEMRQFTLDGTASVRFHDGN